VVQGARQDAAAWTRRPHHLATCCACLLSRLQQQLLPQVPVLLQMLELRTLLLLVQ
jgi:hypothetical protein